MLFKEIIFVHADIPKETIYTEFSYHLGMKFKHAEYAESNSSYKIIRSLTL